jgi:riboflavin kinase/FMN adenylyltransferase
MKVIDWADFLETALPFEGNPSAITVGVFDGVHLGHKTLIEQVVSQKKSAVPVVITFKQSHHKNADNNGQPYPGDILSFRQKAKIFESLGVSITIVIEFSETIRRMKGADFLRVLHDHGKMSFIAVGSDFRCGYQLDTNAAAIQNINTRRGIETCIVQPLTNDGKPISSRLIRGAITQGSLFEAAAMLGRPFTVDLYGDSVFPPGKAVCKTSGKDMVYDISGQGRILPPPGKYPVLLLDKNCDRNTGTPAEIHVEDGNIIITGDPRDTCHEYVEFLP